MVTLAKKTDRDWPAFSGTDDRWGAVTRREGAADELPQTATVTEAIYVAGLQSSGHFYAKSSKVLGMTPAQFRSDDVCRILYQTFHITATHQLGDHVRLAQA